MKYFPINKVLADKISGEWGVEPDDDYGVKVIRTANFTNLGAIDFSTFVLRKIEPKKIEHKKLIHGDVIIEKSGGSPTQPVGRVVYFENPDNSTYLCNNFTTALRPDKSVVFPKFLFYVLFYNHLTQKTLRFQNKTTGIINLKLENYLKSQIPLPPLDDQIRIATVLTRAERLIAKRKESIKALDELLKSTFLEMFGDGVGTITSLGEVIEIQNGQVHPKEEPYSEMYHVGGANIESETGKLMNLQKAKFENLISGKYLFTSEHILYSKIRPYLNKVAMPDFTGICSADIYPIKPKSNHINKYFLRYILMSKQFLAYTDNNSDRANIPKINRKALIQYSFILPPLPLQNQFAAIVEKVESIKAKQTQSLAELENLYASLSQRAFKGELDLSGVPVAYHLQPQE